jgi:hypothetical protein
MKGINIMKSSYDRAKVAADAAMRKLTNHYPLHKHGHREIADEEGALLDDLFRAILVRQSLQAGAGQSAALECRTRFLAE